MHDPILANINKIIERDSKATTYKFALLRGVIDIIQENSPFISIYGKKATIPTGLLIEKWMLYYFPILEYQTPIPQSHGQTNLSFNTQFRKIISYYSKKNGFSGFYDDLKRYGIPKAIHDDFLTLSGQIFKAITGMPMKHIGYSISHRHYSLFEFTPCPRRIRPYVADVNYLIENFGTFNIPVEYYESFKILGSFINGQNSLLFKWAEFSARASRNYLSTEEIISQIFRDPVSDRDIQHSKVIFEKKLKEAGNLFCVWTGDSITRYDIDHVIPYTAWRNNDLWNLMPAKPIINNKKRDKIPTPETIEKHRNQVLFYWEMLNDIEPVKFQKEIRIALVGSGKTVRWQEAAIDQLQKSCQYLISERGYEPWTI